jgi:hypothetical protein
LMRIVGSSPTASACPIGTLAWFSKQRGDHREPAVCETRPEQRNPVVQRQRLLAYTQATVVRVHPGLLGDLSCSTKASRQRELAGASFPCRRHNPATPVLVGELAVPATLSRWRSWVRIPSRTLREIASGTVRKRAKRRSSNLRDLWVRLPLVPLIRKFRVGWALACPSGCNPPAHGQCRFESCPTHSSILFEERQTIRPVRLLAQDGGPSSRKGGFDSRTGQFTERRSW